MADSDITSNRSPSADALTITSAGPTSVWLVPDGVTMKNTGDRTIYIDGLKAVAPGDGYTAPEVKVRA